MVDLTALKQAAHVVRDESGNPVVQIPLPLWQEWLAQLEPGGQIKQINALLQSWEGEANDPEWWNEFREFLKENPLDFVGNRFFSA